MFPIFITCTARTTTSTWHNTLNPPIKLAIYPHVMKYNYRIPKTRSIHAEVLRLGARAL